MNPNSLRRMAAQWVTMFESDEPVSLRLRPTVSKAHPIHKRDPLPTERLVRESEEVLRRATGLNAWIPEKISDLKRAIGTSPEATIFRVGARLAHIGHADDYLYQRLGSLIRLLSPDAPKIEGSPDRAGLERYFSDNRNTFSAKYAPELAYTCYFSTKSRLGGWRSQAAASANIQLIGASSLPEQITDKAFQIGNKYPDIIESWLSDEGGILVVKDVKAKDASLAVDAALDRLRKFADKTSIRRGMIINPYTDFRSHVILESPDLSNPIMFDWRRSRRSMDGLIDNIDRDVAEQAIDEDNELGRLIGIHAKCAYLFEHGNDQEIFQELTGALDLLFGRYLRASPFRDSRRLPRGVHRSDFLIDLSARWLAMNAPHDVYLSTLWKGNKTTREVAKRVAKKRGGSLALAFSNDAFIATLKDNGEVGTLVLDRTLLKLRRLDSSLATTAAWRNGFARRHTRFTLDMLALRSMRNELVHERKSLAGGYYVTLLLELLKSVIEFRVKCSKAYYGISTGTQNTLDIRTGYQRSAENAFVVMMHLFSRDSDWSLFRASKPYFLNASVISKLHISPWGGPLTIALNYACSDGSALNGIRSDTSLPLRDLPDLSKIEIL